MIYSKQKIFCNACGKEIFIEFPKIIGREFKCCSMDCLSEMKWRETISIMNSEYYKNQK
jgi:hypothetical protein